MRVLRLFLAAVAILIFGSETSRADGWENPREVYGPGWGCTSMHVGNPTFDLCKRCDATAGTFVWKVPPGVSLMNPRNEYYTARCEKPDGSGGVSAGEAARPGTNGSPAENASPSPVLPKPPANTTKREADAHPAPSDSERFNLFLCNETSEKIWIAVGGRVQKEDQYHTFRGWWTREPFECPKDKWITLAKGYFYVHAHSRSGKWGKGNKFCVRKEKFEYYRDGKGGCSQRSEQFSQKTTEKGFYIWRLTD